MGDNNIVPYEINKQLVATIRKTVFLKAEESELALFFHNCRRLGVHPLDGLIHPVKRNSNDGERVSFQTSIDYFRSAADETGEYDGQDEPEFGPDNNDGYPEWASVKVYRKGIDRPFVGTARWKEYYPGDKLGFMWRKMPHNQLAKCAEALAFRKAFPQKLHGLYTDDEMLQADIVEVDTGAKKSTPPPQRASEGKGNGEGKASTGNGGGIQTVQKRALEGMFKTLGLDDPLETIGPIIGRKVNSLDDLTKDEADKVMKGLAKANSGSSDPTECTKDPATCSLSGWADGKAFCGPDNEPCPYQKEG
jgi:phage recombination protein Bet